MKTLQNRSFIKTVITFTPVVVVIAYCVATVQVYLYYQLFGVNILPYIEISEILTNAAGLFALITVSIFVLFGVIGLQMFIWKIFSLGSDKKDTPTTDNADNIKEQRGSKSDQKLIAWALVLVMGLPIISGIAIMIKADHYDDLYFEGVNHLIGGALIIAFASLYAWFESLKFSFKEHSLLFVTVLSLLIATGIGISSSIYDFRHIKFDHATLGTTIITDNKVIASTKTYFYIGQTKRYILFYNDVIKGVDMFPAEKVTKITITDNEKTQPLYLQL